MEIRTMPTFCFKVELNILCLMPRPAAVTLYHYRFIIKLLHHHYHVISTLRCEVPSESSVPRIIARLSLTCFQLISLSE